MFKGIINKITSTINEDNKTQIPTPKLSMMDSEYQKIIDSLNQTIQKNIIEKSNYENTIRDLKKENDNLKNKYNAIPITSNSQTNYLQQIAEKDSLIAQLKNEIQTYKNEMSLLQSKIKGSNVSSDNLQQITCKESLTDIEILKEKHNKTIKRYSELHNEVNNELTILKKIVKSLDLTATTFTAIDFETANKKGNSACSIGLTMVDNGKILGTKHYLIKPPTKTFSNTEINGFTYNDVKDAPTFDIIWDEIKQYIENKTIAAHYAKFDISVLKLTLNYYNISMPSIRVIDSCIVARDAFPKLNNHKLPTVSKFLNIKFNHHNAGDDSLACAKIILIAANKIQYIAKYNADIVLSNSKYSKIFFNKFDDDEKLEFTVDREKYILD